MRQALTTVAELVGLALIAVAAGMVAIPAGLAVGGGALVLVGYLAGRA